MMGKIIKYDGIYLKNYKINNKPLFIAVCFIEDYLYFDMQPIDEPVSITSFVLEDLASARVEIYEAIKNNDTDAPDLINQLTKYTVKSNGIVEARFPDLSFIHKDIILLPQLFGGVKLIVDIKSNEYDFSNYDNSGPKTRRLINNISLKYYKF